MLKTPPSLPHTFASEENKLLVGVPMDKPVYPIYSDEGTFVEITVKMPLSVYQGLIDGAYSRNPEGYITLPIAQHITGYSMGYLYTLSSLKRIKSHKTNGILLLNRKELLDYFNAKPKGKKAAEVRDRFLRKLERLNYNVDTSRITRAK